MPRPKGSKETQPRKNSPSEAEAIQRLTEMGMRPLEAFPGNTEMLWRYACIECGREQQRPLKKWRTFGCKVCAKKIPKERIEAALAASLLKLNGVHTSAHAVPVKCERCDVAYELDVYQYLDGKRIAQCRNCQSRKPSTEEMLSRVKDAGFRPVEGLPERINDLHPFQCLTCDRIQQRSINSFSVGKRCRYCAGALVDPADALALFEEKGLRPLVPYPGSARIGWLSECLVCGEKPSPAYTSLVIGQSAGCGYCSGRAVNPESALRIMEENGFDPIGPYPGSQVPWKSTCRTCGNTPSPTYSGVNNGARCIYCFPGGVDYKLPGHLYLISNLDLDAYKFGIQTFNSSRLSQHVKNGWDVQRVFLFETGRTAHTVEQKLKRWIRGELGIGEGVAKSDMPVGGWTETLPIDSLSIKELVSKVEKICEEEGIEITAQDS